MAGCLSPVLARCIVPFWQYWSCIYKMYRSFSAICIGPVITGCLGLVSTRCIDAVVAASTGFVLAGFLVRA